jgi:WD40 repeat protein
MNPPAALHPSLDSLRLFGTGQLTGDEAAGIEAHVSGCPECCGTLHGIADDSFIDLVRRSASPRAASPSGDTTPHFASRLLGENRADSTLPEAGPDAPAIVEVPAELREHPRYRVLELLGHGGMGTVYKAEHRLMQRIVALKLIARDLTTRPGVAERFVRETQTAGRLAHPNIAQAFDAEQAGDTLFLVMEFVPGADLAWLVRERGPLPCAEACRYVRQAALALQYAHERGMVHRDIKPHNLMLTPGGEIKVLDFGLARFVLGQPLANTSQLTEEGLFMGTADYVAPEQARDAHQADTRADVYSLGCTLYHLLTGRVPFPATTVMDKVVKHATEQPAALSALRPGLPAGLEAVLMKMMAKLPDQRYQTPGEVDEALAPFATAGVMAIPLAQPVLLGRRGALIEAGLVREPAGALSQTAVPPASGRRSGRERWRRQLIGLAAGLLFVTAVAGFVVYRIHTDKGELVIETTDDEVEVVVKRGGEVVTIIDTKTDKSVTLRLRSGEYELETKGGEGLRLGVGKATLKRDDRVIANIERKTPIEPEVPKVGEVRRFEGHTEPIVCVAFSHDGRRAVTGSYDGSMRLWDVAAGKELHCFEHPRGPVEGVNMSPDGRLAVSACADKIVRVWDLETGKVVRQLQGHTDSPIGVVFSPDGRRVLSGSHDHTLRLWDVQTSVEIHSFRGDADMVSYIALSPDGRQALSGGRDATVRLWDVDSGREVRKFEGHTAFTRWVAFSPDGRLAASASNDGTVRLWDVATRKEVRRLPGHTGGAYCVTFSPDGRRLLSCGHDRTVRLWDANTGEEQHAFKVNVGVLWCVSFSPDGRYALSAGADAVVRLWRLPDPPAARDRR